ncbi:integrase core domain-containing protein [Tenacibaculum agarivorans]|uniref:integrase core domain-containing protein n=1 Tax=Tenacibaculum agarivorans TaxID=1908389 RepID=UPI00094BB4F1|nr:integrase core domain-containing protein [Tenacibaculum agarivorans]
MRINTNDLTLVRNYLQKYQFLIKEYEQVKNKTHPKYKFVKDFYQANGTDGRTFLKYYNRFKQSGKVVDLLPQKRGPKWKTRRPLPFIEQKVVALRLQGNNKYEISCILKPKLKQFTPTPSGVYNILKRHGVNRLTIKMQQNKRKIIKEKAGELAHIDTHYLPKGVVSTEPKKRYYLYGVIDSCTRVAWVELTEDLTALTTMFAGLRSFNILASHYNIKFKEVLTDNGPEFGKKESRSKAAHPFERMLSELEIKHRYIRPYRPQTNGKIERFWRTIEEDLITGTYFESKEHLKEEILQYLYYYNQERPHQSLNGEAPNNFNQKCQRIS